MSSRCTPLDCLVAERARQDEKWGVQRHTWAQWMAVLMEEVGEAAQEAVKATFSSDPKRIEEHVFDMREELVQTGALCVAIIEHIDEYFATTEPGEHKQEVQP